MACCNYMQINNTWHKTFTYRDTFVSFVRDLWIQRGGALRSSVCDSLPCPASLYHKSLANENMYCKYNLTKFCKKYYLRYNIKIWQNKSWHSIIFLSLGQLKINMQMIETNQTQCLIMINLIIIKICYTN